MFFDIIFGGSDLFAGLIFLFSDFFLQDSLKIFLGVFLLIKGISTFVRIPIWFGPFFFLAGFIDTISGIILYFLTASFWIKIIGLILLIKGLLTIYPLIWSLIPLFKKLKEVIWNKFRKR